MGFPFVDRCASKSRNSRQLQAFYFCIWHLFYPVIVQSANENRKGCSYTCWLYYNYIYWWHVGNYFQNIVSSPSLTSPRPICPPPNSCVSNNNTNLKVEVKLKGKRDSFTRNKLSVTSGQSIWRYVFFIFGLGFKLPLGAVNGPSLKTLRTGPRSLRPWGETGLAAVATWKEFLNDISMGKLLADRC